MTSLPHLLEEAREEFSELLEGRTLHWFESANGKTIMLARLESLIKKAYAQGVEEGMRTSAGFMAERMHFAETRGQLCEFTREELGWWLESAKSGKYPNGESITSEPSPEK